MAATIIPQYETEDLLSEGLCILKEWNSQWTPQFFMTDKSSVELGAIANVFPGCIPLLCDFHRAQAWERWVNSQPMDCHPKTDMVLSYLKNLAYALRSKFSATLSVISC